MNGNPFYVQPALATQSAQRGLAGLGDALVARAERQREEQQRIDAERKAEERRIQVAELYQNAMVGDNAALDELFELDLNFGAKLEQQLYDRAQAKTKAEQDLVKSQSQQFISQMSLAQTSDEQAMVLDKFARDPSLQAVKLDEEFLSVPENMREFSLKTMAKAFGEDYFQSVYGDEAGRPQKVQNTQEAEGGTLVTYTDGKQEFLNWPKEMIDARIEEKERLSQFAPDLSAGQQNTLTKIEDESIESYDSVVQIDRLASRFAENLNAPAGAYASTLKMFETITGQQDALSLLRIDFNRIKNKLITQNLPQGPATDKDIELIQKGFPTDTTNPKVIYEFLQAMSRAQQAIAENKEFEGRFFSEVGNRTKSNRNFTIDGFEINKGDSFKKARENYFKYKEQFRQPETKLNGQVELGAPKQTTESDPLGIR